MSETYTVGIGSPVSVPMYRKNGERDLQRVHMYSVEEGGEKNSERYCEEP